MAHIPYTYVPVEEDKRKLAVYTMPTGGVMLCDTEQTVERGKCRHISNFDILADRIKTRKTQINPEQCFFSCEKLNGYLCEPFYDKLIFHSGTCLYSFDAAAGEAVIIYDALPDSKSLICPFLSKLYIYCATHVYTLDSDFALTEELTYAPEIYTDVLASAPDSSKKNDVPFNLVAPRITVTFAYTATKTFLLPQNLDMTRPVEVYKDDVLLSSSEYELYQNGIKINDSLAYDNYRVVKVVYYLLDPAAAGFEDFISNCRIAVPFGGNQNSGTRVFFTGNSDKKGYYCKSELMNPLYVKDGEFEIIGDGSGDITAVKKMYGDMIVFSDSSVFRMSYNTTDEGVFFTVKEISDQAGCDCPDSVALIDNRVVFANSKKGIFIVDSTEDTGEQNIKPISGNILKGGGRGFLDNTQKLLTSCAAADFDRKYMLFVGERAYIWDYDTTPFRESGSYSTAQSRLCWYIHDGFCGSVFAQIGKTLVALHENEGVYVYVYSGENAAGGIECEFESGASECFYPLTRKHVTSLSLKLTREGEGSTAITLYADGETYYKVNLPQAVKPKEKIILRPPLKAMYSFGFAINTTQACEIEEISAQLVQISE